MDPTTDKASLVAIRERVQRRRSSIENLMLGLQIFTGEDDARTESIGRRQSSRSLLEGGELGSRRSTAEYMELLDEAGNIVPGREQRITTTLAVRRPSQVQRREMRAMDSKDAFLDPLTARLRLAQGGALGGAPAAARPAAAEVYDLVAARSPRHRKALLGESGTSGVGQDMLDPTGPSIRRRRSDPGVARAAELIRKQQAGGGGNHAHSPRHRDAHTPKAPSSPRASPPPPPLKQAAEPRQEPVAGRPRSSSSQPKRRASHGAPMLQDAGLAFRGFKMTRRPDITLSEMRIKSKLGEGQFGRVLCVEVGPEDQPEKMAMKILERQRFSSARHEAMVMAERRLIEKINHPFHIKLINTYKTPTRLFMLMELAPGQDLSRRITNQGIKDLSAVQFYAACIVLALRYLHMNGIIHRDVKPSNLLIDSSGYVKVCDYGFSKELPIGGRARTFTGTYAYLSPELCRRESYDHGVDVWTIGVTIYEMVYGRTPFEADGRGPDFPQQTIQNILHKDLVFPELMPFPFPGRMLVKGLLRRDRSERLGADLNYTALLEHKFFANIDWEELEAKRIPAPYVPDV